MSLTLFLHTSMAIIWLCWLPNILASQTTLNQTLPINLASGYDSYNRNNVQPNVPTTIQSTFPKNPSVNCPASCINDWNKSPIIILAVDGAAVRGVAQFALLRAIEERVNAEIMKRYQTKAIPLPPGEKFIKIQRQSITDIFDFFAGTSAGSINVGIMLVPQDPLTANTSDSMPAKAKYSLDELNEKLYDTINTAFATSTFRKIRTLGGLLGSKFSAKPSEALLQDYMGRTRISDLVKPGLITSYDVRGREIFNFSTHDACALKQSNEEVIYFQKPDENNFTWKQSNVFLWEAVRASCAAPVFYKPLEVNINGKSRALIDAGLFVMSPTLLAWIEAQKIYPGRRFIIISISSGNLVDDRKVKATGATAGGIPAVLKPTIETAIEGQQALTDKMMHSLPGVYKYHRLSFDVTNKDFDDTSENNIKSLITEAQKTIESVTFKEAINDLVDARLERKSLNDVKPYICAVKKTQLDLINQASTKAHAINSKQLKDKQQLFTPEQAEVWRTKETFKKCQILKQQKKISDWNALKCQEIK